MDDQTARNIFQFGSNLFLSFNPFGPNFHPGRLNELRADPSQIKGDLARLGFTGDLPQVELDELQALFESLPDDGDLGLQPNAAACWGCRIGVGLLFAVLGVAAVFIAGGVAAFLAETALIAEIAAALGVPVAVLTGRIAPFIAGGATFLTLGIIGQLLCGSLGVCQTPTLQAFILSRSSGKVLDVPGFATADGVVIEQFQLNRGTNQQWLFFPSAINGNVNKIVSLSSGKVLDVPHSETADGVLIQQFTDNKGKGVNQQWRLVRVDGTADFVKIVSEVGSNGKVLDVPHSETADGVQIQQWTDNGSTNQQWRLIPVVG